ncbi:MAG: class I SAM-dependent methyltransferase [Clostridiales bacterium]|nr:class I SAM-dependent methyltransferase [Clostridiales bacterium]
MPENSAAAGEKNLQNENKDIIVGKIRLNLRHYPGEDLYCDGDIEDTLLDITRNYAQVEYQRIIEERRSWPVLYHLSPLRENIVEWLPITKEMKVLEVGSGCGAITGALARKSAEVTCIDLSKKRSLINAYRHMDVDNVTIHVGNFQDVEPDLPCDYDYICLIGVFEYGQAYISSETPYEDFLSILKKHMKPEGHIAIAIENQFGLKYWAGCKEDHLGTYFSGLEGYPDGGVVRTFTKDGLMKIAGRCGFTRAQMYYPYPDYKFMTTLYSDARLPRQGELSSNLRNFDRDRLQLFDEKKVFDTIIREEQFPLFSNSYMLLLGSELEEEYVKYSNDRKEEFRIKTVQKALNGGQTQKIIEKHPLSKTAWKHIEDTFHAYEKLKERYADGELSVNQCTLHRNQEGVPYVTLEYLEGRTLEEILDECLEKKDLQGFQRFFDAYLHRISYGEEKKVSDYDLIFANILIPSGEKENCEYNNRWNLIDYEWTFEKAVETKQIAFRAVYCYLLENEKRNALNLDLIMDSLHITQSDAEQYRREEMKFQKYVTGGHMSMDQLREAMGNPVYTTETFCAGQEAASRRDRVQIYEDTGKGFNEEQSFFLEDQGEQVSVSPEGKMELQVEISGGRSALRIDPCSDSCLIYLKKISWNGEEISLKGKQTELNGFRIGERVYAFPTKDPNITLSLSGLVNEERNLLQLSMEMTRMSEEALRHMQKRGLFS